MEGAERIVRRIIKDANEKAENIIKQAEEQAAQIIFLAREEAEKRKETIVKRATKEAGEKRNRLIAAAELEARKMKLKAKQDVITEAIDRAINELNSMPPIQYRDIIASMVTNSVKKGNEELIVSDKDRTRLGEDFPNTVNEMLKKRNLKGNIQFSEIAKDIGGGFILKSGDIETNNSFITIIRMKYSEIEMGIVEIFF